MNVSLAWCLLILVIVGLVCIPIWLIWLRYFVKSAISMYIDRKIFGIHTFGQLVEAAKKDANFETYEIDESLCNINCMPIFNICVLVFYLLYDIFSIFAKIFNKIMDTNEAKTTVKITGNVFETLWKILCKAIYWVVLCPFNFIKKKLSKLLGKVYSIELK